MSGSVEKSALSVNKGVNKPKPVNEDAIHNFLKKKKKLFTAKGYLDGIKNGDRVILSQAITLVESCHPDHQELAQNIIDLCVPHSGNSLRIGITGVPGVGKSTFIESFGTLLTSKGRKVAVLAIDPSSQRSKGSILGDKTRMEELSSDPMAFIRPSPSAGTLGGVARKTRETIILCEAAGFDTIFIETVGVGQSETAVHSMVDFFLLLMLAGAGDELQGIKKGIMEMADTIVITKADGANIQQAELAKQEYENALHLFPASYPTWTPRVIPCSALSKKGLDDIWQVILEYANLTKKSEFFQQKRNDQAKFRMHEAISEKLLQLFYNDKRICYKITEVEQKVLNNQISSYHAAKILLDEYILSGNSLPSEK